MFVDTNVILRALLNDHPDHSSRAQRFFKSARAKQMHLETSDAVIAEVFYVLESPKIKPLLTRQAIADLLVSFIQLVDLRFPARAIFSKVLTFYKQSALDVTDLLLTTQASHLNEKVLSFDKGLDKVAPKIRVEP